MNQKLACARRSTLPAFVALCAVILLSFGSAARAAPAPAVCPAGEGGPYCELIIVAPDSVPANQPFTVEVDVTTDGTTIAKNDACAATIWITLYVQYQGEGSYSETYRVKAKGGVAKFEVTLPYDGPYSLDAYIGEGDECNGYYLAPDTTYIEAANITPGQPIAPCPPGQVCTQTDSGGGSAATLFSPSGSFFDVFWGTLDYDGCGGAGPADSYGVLNFNHYNTGAKKTIIFWLDADLVTKKAKKYEVCWSSPDAFTPLKNTTLAFDGTYYTGYLPKCHRKDPGPCVLKKKDVKHVGAYFVILAPPGDPKVYPE